MIRPNRTAVVSIVTRSWQSRSAYPGAQRDASQVAAAIKGEASPFLTNDKRIKKVDAIEVAVLSNYL